MAEERSTAVEWTTHHGRREGGGSGNGESGDGEGGCGGARGGGDGIGGDGRGGDGEEVKDHGTGLLSILQDKCRII